MADTDTHTESLALYQFLCQNIVGTENHVKTIRLLNSVRDNVISNKYHVTITSGSFGEGLDMRGSDLDIMHVVKPIEVYSDEKKRQRPNIQYYYRMVTDDVKPGYTHLLPENNGIKLKVWDEFNGVYFLSSTLLKQSVLGTSYSDIHKIHGPCLSHQGGQIDQAFCLHCKTWISQAFQWITRSNNSWPSYNVKQSIIKHGVLFVPIGVKGSPKEDIEWRISFSVGEKMLINTFTHTQLLCYALLKILVKDVLETNSECSDLLCSYFVKTIIFWISEELPQSIWKPNNLIYCFSRCFSRLIYCIKYSACLHYFIPENNLFENKIEGRARELLLDRLYTLHSYGWRCVLFSDQLSNFHVSMLINHVEPHSLHTIDIAKILNSKLLYFSNNWKDVEFEIQTYVYKKGIRLIMSCDKSYLKYLYTYYLSLRCAQSAQTISLNSTTNSNKQQYKQYNSCLCTLLQNIYHDAVSGWLMLASFFYTSKQYKKALCIIMYSLSKCTAEKLYSFMEISDIQYQLLELKLFQKKTIVRLWKTMLIDFMKFGKKSCLIPNELHMEVENEVCFISSIVYAYFLKFLCHYHLNNVRQCQNCLHTLQLILVENYCIEQNGQLPSEDYKILGIALQMSGDYEAARRSFLQSLELYPDHKFNTSYKRLSLMSSL
ncbi:cyclic GMP-AMP synthase-like receptor 2 [Mytilus edulis]|uniref:cyclic GMP-AMP synthase-like receptor 2 n=1 Tax=Mytilus edulis TaxID=6550 RepID=UPI0039EF5C39